MSFFSLRRGTDSASNRHVPSRRRGSRRPRPLRVESLEGRELLAVVFQSAMELDTPGQAEASAVAAGPNGETYLAGTNYHSDPFDLDPANVYSDNRDIVQTQGGFVAKYNADQTLAWVNLVTRSNVDSTPSAFHLAVDGDGDVYVQAHFYDDVQLGSLSLTADYFNGDNLIAKISAAGEPQWMVSDGVANAHFVSDIAVTPAGDAVYFGGRGVVPETLSQRHYAYVSKLDGDGAAVWTKTATPARTTNNFALNAVNSLTIDSAGNPIAVGRVGGQTDFDPGSGTLTLGVKNGDAQAFVWKLTSGGSLGWAGAFTGGQASANDVAIDGAGNVLVVGNFTGTVDFNPNTGKNAVNKLTSDAAGDSFLARLSSTGVYLSAYNVGIAGVGGATSQVALDSAGFIYVGRGAEILKLNASGVLLQTVSLSVAPIAPDPTTSLSFRFAIDAASNRLLLFGQFEGDLYTTPDNDGNPSTPLFSSTDGDLFWATFEIT